MAIELEYPEGSTPLETEELDELIPGHITTQGQLNEWEALNIAKGLKWAYTSRGDMLTEAFCKKLHKAMFDETWAWAGEFRRTNKNIGCDWHLIGVELRKTLDDVRYWMENETFTIHEIALRAHHKLVYVHPFPNGNGRFCRAMADILVARARKPALLWNDFGNLVDQNDVRKGYIESLRKADNEDYSVLIDLCTPK